MQVLVKTDNYQDPQRSRFPELALGLRIAYALK